LKKSVTRSDIVNEIGITIVIKGEEVTLVPLRAGFTTNPKKSSINQMARTKDITHKAKDSSNSDSHLSRSKSQDYVSRSASKHASQNRVLSRIGSIRHSLSINRGKERMEHSNIHTFFDNKHVGMAAGGYPIGDGGGAVF
jgi:hypothetical protein